MERLKYQRKFFVSDKVSMSKKYEDLFFVYRKPFLICLGLAFFSQAAGTSAFLYYGAEIFFQTQADVDGIDERHEGAIILDDFVLVAFVIGNLISAFLIMKAGRRQMMLWSLPGAFVSLCFLSWTMKESNYGEEEAEVDEKNGYRHMERVYFTITIVIYTLCVSIGLSTTVWSITSEILPNYLLAIGSSLTQSFGWIINFIINTFFLDALEDPVGRWVVFLVFAVMVALAILFVALCVPETVGKSTRSNLAEMLGKDYIHKQTKKLRKEYDIIDIEVKEPEIR